MIIANKKDSKKWSIILTYLRRYRVYPAIFYFEDFEYTSYLPYTIAAHVVPSCPPEVLYQGKV